MSSYVLCPNVFFYCIKMAFEKVRQRVSPVKSPKSAPLRRGRYGNGEFTRQLLTAGIAGEGARRGLSGFRAAHAIGSRTGALGYCEIRHIHADASSGFAPHTPVAKQRICLSGGCAPGPDPRSHLGVPIYTYFAIFTGCALIRRA